MFTVCLLCLVQGTQNGQCPTLLPLTQGKEGDS